MCLFIHSQWHSGSVLITFSASTKSTPTIQRPLTKLSPIAARSKDNYSRIVCLACSVSKEVCDFVYLKLCCAASCSNYIASSRLTIHFSAVTKVYPPKSNADLRSLVDHIVASELDIHHKQALIYYLLKDCRNALGAAEDFASSCYLPEKYRLFIEGLWHMDHLDFRVCRCNH